MSEQSTGPEWVVIELMGHRKLAGLLSEVTRAGQGLLRLQIPGDDDDWYATQDYSPTSVYCITPTSEATARAFAKTSRPAPVTRWELPGLPAPHHQIEAGEEVEEPDDPDLDGDREVWFMEPEQLTPEVVSTMLALADERIDIDTVETWTELEQLLAYDYACRVHYHASDNDDIKVRPRPTFLGPRVRAENPF